MGTAPEAPNAPPAREAPRGTLVELWHRLGASDRLFKLACQSAAVLVLVLMALLVVSLAVESWPAVRHFGPAFLVTQAWDPRGNLGALTFVWGTLITSAVAMVLAVPLGIGSATYLAEIAPGWARRAGSFLIELLAAIPSVVYGFWGFYFLRPALQVLFGWLDAPLRAAAEVPGLSWLYTPNTSGNGILAAGVILSIMILPYITAVAFDVCRAVPRSQREGALALGATRWQMIWKVVLPYARPGIVGGCFLAVGRALGETMAVVMLIGNNNQTIDVSPFAKGATIASVIANELNESDGLKRSALVGLGLVLLLVTIAVNTLARLLIWRVGRTGRGRAAPAGGEEEVPPVPPAKPAAAEAGPAEKVPFSGGNPMAAWVNWLMTNVLALCLLVTLGPLFLILSDITFRGVAALYPNFYADWPAPPEWQYALTHVLTFATRVFTAFDVNFFTNLPNDRPPGLAHALLGSAMLVGLATLWAVPVGILAAVYLAEYRTNRLAAGVRFVGELLGRVPSIVLG